MKRTLPGTLAILAVMTLVDCTCGHRGARCVPGQVVDCPCEDGTTGHQVCDSKGAKFESCVCNPSNVGVVDIRVAPVEATVTFENMAPGDTAEGTVTVTNSGREPFRYAVASITEEARLSGFLELQVGLGSGGLCSRNNPTLYGPAMLGAPGGVNIVGNPAAGNHPGDRVLGSGHNELLCFWVDMPLAADNSWQGMGTTMTLGFYAEQIEDNP